MPKYWVNGSGLWSDTTHWSATSGGAGSDGVPISSSDVVFDSASNAIDYTVTVDASSNCKGLTFGNPASGALTFAGSSTLDVYGAISLAASMVFTFSGLITFKGTTTYNVTSNGISFAGDLTFNGSGGTWTLQDAFVTTGTMTMTLGTFTANTNNVTVGKFSGSGGTLNMSTGTWLVTGGNNPCWNATSGLTVSASSSTIKFTNNSALDQGMTGHTSHTYWNIWIATAGIGNFIYTGGQTCNEFKVDAGRSIVFPNAYTPIIKVLTATGSLGSLCKFRSDNTTLAKITVASGASVWSNDYMDLDYIDCSTISAFYAGVNSTDGGHNTRLNFIAPDIRYWVLGTGTWDASSTTHWSLTSGGAAGASVPASGNDVVFDVNSAATTYTVTMGASATLNCRNLKRLPPATNHQSWTAAIGGSTLNIYGDFENTETSCTPNCGVNFIGSLGKKTYYNTQGLGANSSISFNGTGREWKLLSNLINGSYSPNYLFFLAGTLDSNGFLIGDTNCDVQTLGSGTFSLILHGETQTVKTWSISSIGFTITAGTSIIKTGAFNGGTTQTYYEVWLTASSAFSAATLGGANTFTNLKLLNGAVYGGISVAADQTVTGALTITGTNSTTQRLFVFSSVKGTPRTITNNGTYSVTDADFLDITGAGSTTWTGGTRHGDCGGNSGITFSSPITCYWVHGGTASVKFYNALWFTSSGGAVAARVPLPQDTARFDGSSFGASGKTVISDISLWRMPILNFASVSNNPMISITISQEYYGSVTLEPGAAMTWANTTTATFKGRGALTLLSAGKTFSSQLVIDMFGNASNGNSLSLSDDLLNGAFTLTSGCFYVGAHNVQTGNILSSNSNNRLLDFGSGTWTMIGTNVNFTTATGLDITAGTSTIKFTNSGVGTRTFVGGSKTYNNIWFTSAIGTNAITIAGNNTFNDFKDDGLVAHNIQFVAGTTQTFTTFTVSGTAGQLKTIKNTSGTGTYALVKSGGGTISSDYLNIQHSVATPASTWYAGVNSVDNQAVVTAGSGWIFTDPTASSNGNFFFFL